MITRSRQLEAWIVVLGAAFIVLGALSVRGQGPAAATAPTAVRELVAASSSSPVPASPPAMPVAHLLPEPSDAALPPPRSAATAAPTSSMVAAPIATPTPTVATTPAPPPPPGGGPTPVPVADPNPVLLTESRVSGAFGQTLNLEGYSVMLKPAASPWESECTPSMPDAQHFELIITSTIPFGLPHLGQGGMGVTICMKGPLPFASGQVIEVVLPVAAGTPVTVWINPDDGPHTLVFDFN